MVLAQNTNEIVQNLELEMFDIMLNIHNSTYVCFLEGYFPHHQLSFAFISKDDCIAPMRALVFLRT
jgi:hypothetical protein